MDRELADYPDRCFDGVDERFRQVDRRLGDVDQGLAEGRPHTETLVAEARQHAEALALATRRHVDMAAEGLRGQAIAEGQLDLTRQIQEMHREHEAGQRDVLAAIKFSYAELDRRLTRIESVTVDLDARVGRLGSGR